MEEKNVMKLDDIKFGSRFVTAIRLGFLIHNLVVFSKKRKNISSKRLVT
jgi:hypothetical protein